VHPTRHPLRWTASALGALATAALAAEPPAPPPLDVAAHERLLVVAPHPDDETLGAGGLIARVLERGGSARVVLVTMGDGYVEAVRHETGELRPRPAEYVAYGERRLGEARAAMRELGGGRVRLGPLGFPDGGLGPLLEAHWSRADPERSPTTAAERPPYREALDPRAAYDGADLRRELVHVLRETQPTMLAFPHPLDRHPDHRATGLFTLMAVGDWLDDAAPPRLLAYLVHWPGWPPGWEQAKPDPSARRRPLVLPDSLPTLGVARTALVLSEREVALEAAALRRYVTQQEVMPRLLASFVRSTEPFTIFSGASVREVGRLIAAPPPGPP
jgi:LmbE family N-acetylglucosaminyl deacetylase